MATKKFSSSARFAAFIAAAALTLSAVQPSAAQTIIVPDSNGNAQIYEHGPSAPLSFKNGTSAVVTPRTPSYASDGSMVIDVLLKVYAPSNGTPACCTMVNSYVSNLQSWLHAGSQWLGTGSRSVTFNIVATSVSLTESPRISTTQQGDVGAVLSSISTSAGDGCAYIAQASNPVHVWIMGTSRGHFEEYMIGGPRFTNANDTKHNMPTCGQQYVAFGFAYRGESTDGANDWFDIINDNMLHDYGHYWEWLMNNSALLGYKNIACNALNPTGGAVNSGNTATQYYKPSGYITSTPLYVADLYECNQSPTLPMGPRSNLMVRPTNGNGGNYYVGCGDVHFPPNRQPWNDAWTSGYWTNAYIYWDTTQTYSNCPEWWNQYYTRTLVSCYSWGCTDAGFYQWWMQHIPGRNTTAYDRSNVNYGASISSLHYGWWGLMWL